MGMEAVPEFVRYPQVKWMTSFHNKLPLTTDGILEVKVITKPVDYSNPGDVNRNQSNLIVDRINRTRSNPIELIDRTNRTQSK